MTRASRRITAARRKMLLVAGIVFLGSASHAQVNDEPKKWLKCNIDWLTSAPQSAGPNFTVKILFHNAPVPSVKVVLRRQSLQPNEQEVVAAGKTNRYGIARFSAIPFGEYTIYLDEDLLSPRGEKIEIDARSKATTEIDFRWPEKSIVARYLRGLLLASDESEDMALPLPYVPVQLFDLRSASLIASTNSDGEGNYEFPSFGDGLYVVRLSKDQYSDSEHYDMAVEIKSAVIGDDIPTMKIVREGCNPGLFGLDSVNQ